MSHTAAPSRRRALLPLATLLVAASIAMATGANFTSASENPGNGFATGTLRQTNSLADDAIFNLNNLKPGDSVTGQVTITNSGSLPATFFLSEEEIANTFAEPELLTLTVTGPGIARTAQLGEFGEGLELGTWGVGSARTFTFTASLDEDASNLNQGRSVNTAYSWDAIQTDGTEFDHEDISIRSSVNTTP